MSKLDRNNVTAELWDQMVTIRMWAVETVLGVKPDLLAHDPVQFMQHAAALTDFVYEEAIPEKAPKVKSTSVADFKQYAGQHLNN
jgi:hypothetical protein